MKDNHDDLSYVGALLLELELLRLRSLKKLALKFLS